MKLEEYFSKLRQSDKNAFEKIYGELKTPVYTIAYRIVQSRECAEDIAHDVFLKLYKSPPSKEVKNPRAWVFQMTRNLSLDMLRKKKPESIEGDISQAYDVISDSMIRMDIEKAIGILEPREREVITLHLTCDIGFKEISIIMGESLPAVYRKYRKALKSIQKYINGGEK